MKEPLLKDGADLDGVSETALGIAGWTDVREVPSHIPLEELLLAPTSGDGLPEPEWTPAWAPRKREFLELRAESGLVLPAGSRLRDLALAEAVIALNDAAVLPALRGGQVIEITGGWGPVLDRALAQHGCEVLSVPLEVLVDVGPADLRLAVSLLGTTGAPRSQVSAAVEHLHRLGVPYVYMLDAWALPDQKPLPEVLAGGYWTREIPILEVAFTEPPPFRKQVRPRRRITPSNRLPQVGARVRHRRGDADAPRHLIGWRKHHP